MANEQEIPTGGNLPSNQMKVLARYIEDKQPNIAKYLGKQVGVERWAMLALRTINKNPDLLQCTPQSLYAGMIEAAGLNLEIDGVLGLAYLVPYKKTAQMQIGYKGLVELARRSGQVRTIQADVVYDGDKFEMEKGPEGFLKHIPVAPSQRKKHDLAGQPADKILGFYAIVKWSGAKANSGADFEWMWLEEVEAVRSRSRAKSGPWFTDYVEMGKKTVIRRLCKVLPLASSVARVIAREEQMDAGVYEPEDPIEASYETVDSATGEVRTVNAEPEKAGDTAVASDALQAARAAHETKKAKDAKKAPKAEEAPAQTAQEPKKDAPTAKAEPAAKEEAPTGVREDLGFHPVETAAVGVRIVHGVPVKLERKHFAVWSIEDVPGADQPNSVFAGLTWGTLRDAIVKGDAFKHEKLRIGVQKGIEQMTKGRVDASIGLERAALTLEQIDIQLSGSKPSPAGVQDSGLFV